MMKKILIDLYKTKTLYSGLGQFSLNFAEELMRQLPQDIQIDFLVPRKNTPPLTLDHRSAFVKSNVQIKYLPALSKTYSLWHTLYQSPSRWPNSKTPQVMTIHDLNFLIEKQGKKIDKYLKAMQQAVDRADYITAISLYAKKSIEDNIDLKGKEIRMIYNGVAINKPQKIDTPKFADNQKFFFSIGSLEKKKHFESLVALIKHFDDRKVIIAGNFETSYGKEIIDLISTLGVEDKVILPGKVSDAERLWLYTHCEALLFPSRAEGFGMPPIEAMQFGKPVFLSKMCSLPEIGGEVAHYFEDIYNYEEMALLIKTKMAEFYQNPKYLSERSKAHASQFSWEKSMQEYIKLYTEILN